MRKQIIIMLILTCIVNIGFAQKKKKVFEPDTAIIKLIESRDFKVRATTAIPGYGKSVSLDNRYSVEIKGDSVISHLPYFGRAYTLPYGGGEGLIFNSTITKYQTKQTKKEATEIKFSTRTGEDLYEYTLTIYPGGSASIRVTPNNKQAIDFLGNIN